MTPPTGPVPLNVNMTCGATDATSYLIDCGNSTSITARTGVCRYPVAGTYTPKCSINGTLTSPACTKTVIGTIPTPLPVPEFNLTLKKYVKSNDIFSVVAPTEDFNYNIIVTNE